MAAIALPVVAGAGWLGECSAAAASSALAGRSLLGVVPWSLVAVAPGDIAAGAGAVGALPESGGADWTGPAGRPWSTPDLLSDAEPFAGVAPGVNLLPGRSVAPALGRKFCGSNMGSAISAPR